MSDKNLNTDLQDGILYLTINREQKLNALNRQTLAELAEAIKMAAEQEEVRGILLTGAGEKAFVAGADISEFADFDTEQGKGLARDGQANVFDAIAHCPKPVVAAINGFALGGGLELAMACHIRVAASNARLGLPEVTLGLIPGYGGTQRLTKLVGAGHAMEMILTADMIDASRALEIGLVNHVVAPEDLKATCLAILQKIKLRAPLAIAAAIKAVNAAGDGAVNGYDVEIDGFAGCFGTADFKEGVSAFLEKRKPVFKGN